MGEKHGASRQSADMVLMLTLMLTFYPWRSAVTLPVSADKEAKHV